MYWLRIIIDQNKVRIANVYTTLKVHNINPLNGYHFALLLFFIHVTERPKQKEHWKIYLSSSTDI